MRVPAYAIPVYRNKKWITIQTTELLPGDVCSVGRSDAADRVVPCDLLLLGGTAVVNEALLTGESVPQLKVSCLSLYHQSYHLLFEREFEGVGDVIACCNGYEGDMRLGSRSAFSLI